MHSLDQTKLSQPAEASRTYPGPAECLELDQTDLAFILHNITRGNDCNIEMKTTRAYNVADTLGSSQGREDKGVRLCED